MSAPWEAILLLGVELGEQDEPTQELCLRVYAAAQAYARGQAPLIMACGGVLPGHACAEADVMAELLCAQGVPKEAIRLERQSQDTMGNFRCALHLPDIHPGMRVLVVTSGYHVPRAVMTARRLGLRARGRAAQGQDATGVLWLKELCYIFDLLMGWQDEGHTRPAWTLTLFDWVFSFGKRRRENGHSCGR